MAATSAESLSGATDLELPWKRSPCWGGRAGGFSPSVSDICLPVSHRRREGATAFSLCSVLPLFRPGVVDH